MSETQTGQCMCGAVRFRVSQPAHEIGVCHCDMCRRWGSGPMFALHCKGPVEFEGEEHIATYRSSDWAERGFCRICGSNLFYRLLESGEYAIAVGTLDDQSGLAFESQIFIEEKPGWYTFADDTKTMTGAEAFAFYAPPDEAEK